MNKEISLIEYPELLKQLGNSRNNHLLLGNGFNMSLEIDTSYENIFSRMLEEESVYEKIKKEIREESIKYDIEKLIGELRKCFDSQNGNIDKFLDAYVEQKVKLDFMKATSSIVGDKVKGIYKNKNRGVYNLFKNFDNYFTLNYDTFLYLLLMSFKKSDGARGSEAVSSKTLSSGQKDLNKAQSNIYDEILMMREKGELRITFENDEHAEIELKNSTKGHFQANVEQYNKKRRKGWKVEDIRRACDEVWEDESNNLKLDNVNDGFQKDLFEEGNTSQNVFFLHGSLHIYRDEHLIKKITQKQNRALYHRLVKIVQEEEEEIVCVLTDVSARKKKYINRNNYLKKCFEKLSQLSGNVVILGSSLSDNDKHIFQTINRPSIKKIYISSCDEEKQEHSKQSKKFFPEKEIVWFNYESICYDEENGEKE